LFWQLGCHINPDVFSSNFNINPLCNKASRGLDVLVTLIYDALSVLQIQLLTQIIHSFKRQIVASDPRLLIDDGNNDPTGALRRAAGALLMERSGSGDDYKFDGSSLSYAYHTLYGVASDQTSLSASSVVSNDEPRDTENVKRVISV